MLSSKPPASARARRIRDWPLLERAVDAKIEEQIEFCQWWRDNVSVRESPGRGGVKSNAARGSIPRDDAESLTGITQQQVSRWRKRIADVQPTRTADGLATSGKFS